MNDKVTVINVSPVAQTVAGHPEVAPGGSLQVEGRVAAHLLNSQAWAEPKPKRAAGRAAGQSAPAESKEVSDGAD